MVSVRPLRGTVAARRQWRFDTTLNAPLEAGRYYYRVCLDTVAGEIRSDNNCSVDVAVRVIRSDPSDRAALEAFYHATDGPGWSGRGWLTAAPISEWEGVTTDARGRVTALRLGYRGLSGRLPPELGNLGALGELYLPGNRLSGGIPPELANLNGLAQLDLAGNELSGEIPHQLGRLAEVRQLRLEGNGLTGAIPSELGDLGELESLDLSDNGLTGAIPSELGRLTGLSFLSLANNDLNGAIPAEFGGLVDLRYLYLYQNRLSGGIPAELGGLGRLRYLSLYENRLSGGIPAELGGLGRLRGLYLHQNRLNGPVPAGFAGESGDAGSRRERVERCDSGGARAVDRPRDAGSAPEPVDGSFPRVVGGAGQSREFDLGMERADGSHGLAWGHDEPALVGARGIGVDGTGSGLGG